MSDLLSQATVATTSDNTANSNGDILQAEIHNYKFDNSTIDGLAKDSSAQSNQKFAGKYVSVEELEKGYTNASDKIRQQAEELKSFKEKYLVPDKYELDTWIKDGSLPEHLNLNAPELMLGIEAFKKAGLSTEQAKIVLAEYINGVAKNTLSDEDNIKLEIKKFQSEDEYKAVSSKLSSFMDNLPTDKQQKFKEMCGDANAMKLMYDIIFPKESKIPTGNPTVNKEEKAKLYSEIQQFKKDNHQTLSLDKSQQTNLDNLWRRFHQAI